MVAAALVPVGAFVLVGRRRRARVDVVVVVVVARSLEDVSLDDRVIARASAGTRDESSAGVKSRCDDAGDALDDARRRATTRENDASRGAHAKTNKTKAKHAPNADAATARASRNARADGAPT